MNYSCFYSKSSNKNKIAKTYISYNMCESSASRYILGCCQPLLIISSNYIVNLINFNLFNFFQTLLWINQLCITNNAAWLFNCAVTDRKPSIGVRAWGAVYWSFISHVVRYIPLKLIDLSTILFKFNNFW